AGVFHTQRNVRKQLLLQPRAQIAGGDELSFTAREGRSVDRENHRQGRLVDQERLKRRRVFEFREALADLDAFDARNGHDIARRNLLGFIAIEAAEREELRDLRRLNGSIQLRYPYFRPARVGPVENAGNREAPQKIAVIEVRHLNLKDARGVARRRRNRSDDLLEKRLEGRR